MIIGNTNGRLDPLVRKRTENKKPILDSEVSEKFTINDFALLDLRYSMGGKTKDLSEHKIDEQDLVIPCGDHYVLARKYQSKNVNNTSCLIYLHGGAFLGGSILSVENQCRLIADKGGFRVISLDYRLSPETPFPGAYDDLKKTVDYLIDNYEALEIDPNKIYVAGDSAGGNLAIVLGLNDFRHQIQGIITLYAALDFTATKDTIYHWSYSDYLMNGDEELIHTRLNKFLYLNKLVPLIYLRSNKEITNPNVSPVYSQEFSNLPPVFSINAEYDYYYPSNKFFLNKLKKNRKQFQEVVFEGLDHGFFDRLGYLPQTEKAIDIICKVVKENSMF